MVAAGDNQPSATGRVARERAEVCVGFHHDDLTAVTLVHVTTPGGDAALAERHLDVLEAALGRCVTAELLDSLASEPEPPESRPRRRA